MESLAVAQQLLQVKMLRALDVIDVVPHLDFELCIAPNKFFQFLGKSSRSDTFSVQFGLDYHITLLDSNIGVSGHGIRRADFRVDRRWYCVTKLSDEEQKLYKVSV